jgi:hypothetical protein
MVSLEFTLQYRTPQGRVAPRTGIAIAHPAKTTYGLRPDYGRISVEMENLILKRKIRINQSYIILTVQKAPQISDTIRFPWIPNIKIHLFTWLLSLDSNWIHKQIQCGILKLYIKFIRSPISLEIREIAIPAFSGLDL